MKHLIIPHKRKSTKKCLLVEEDPKDPILDKEIKILALGIIELLNKNYLLKEIPLQTSKEKMLKYFNYIFSKKNRNKNEILIIKQYLSTFQKYSEVNESKEKDQMLTKISQCLKYEYKPNGYIICCLGEPGDKFYILLKGIVTVLIPQEYDFEMKEKDYLKHLRRLYKMEEYDILQKTIYSNNHIKLTQEFYDLILRFNIHIKDHKVSINDYLDRIMPITSEEEDEKKILKIKVKLWNYKKVCDIYAGGTFGEVALMDEYSKRTASIITIEPCIFGTIYKDDYQEFIQESENKIRRNNIINLLTHHLFKDVREEIFVKHNFFNLFRYIEFNQGEYIIKQGNKRDEIFFIKEGEVSIEMKASIKDINNILINFGFKIDDKKYEKILKNNPMFRKLYYTKRYFRIINVDKKDIIGLNEYNYLDKYFASAKVISQKCTVFALEIPFLDILLKDRIIKENLKNLIPKRIKFITSRLLDLKNSYLNKFLEYIKEDEESIRNQQGLYSKSLQNFQKRAFKIKNTQNNINKRNFSNDFETFRKKINLTIFSTEPKIKTPNQISFNSTNTFIPHNDNNKNNLYSLKTFSNFNNKPSIKLIKKNQSKPIFPGIDLYKIKSQTEQNLKKDNEEEVFKCDNNNISNSKNIIKYLRFKNNLVNKLIKSSSSLLKKDMIKKFRKEKKFISASNVDFLAFDKYIEKIEKNSEIFVHKKKEGMTGKKCLKNKFKIIPVE